MLLLHPELLALLIAPTPNFKHRFRGFFSYGTLAQSDFEILNVGVVQLYFYVVNNMLIAQKSLQLSPVLRRGLDTYEAYNPEENAHCLDDRLVGRVVGPHLNEFLQIELVIFKLIFLPFKNGELGFEFLDLLQLLLELMAINGVLLFLGVI